jgi:hypothetical protein
MEVLFFLKLFFDGGILLNESAHSKDLSVDVRIILKLTLNIMGAQDKGHWWRLVNTVMKI